MDRSVDVSSLCCSSSFDDKDEEKHSESFVVVADASSRFPFRLGDLG